jgi:hypothetical protein
VLSNAPSFGLDLGSVAGCESFCFYLNYVMSRLLGVRLAGPCVAFPPHLGLRSLEVSL